MGLYNNRIVVKVGTSTLTNDAGKSDLRATDRLVCTLADIHNMGYEVILVSSGAIAVGKNKLNMHTRPDSMRMKQAAAAVGQCSLMYLYDKFFGDYDKTVAQILLNAEDIEQEEKKENLTNTFNALLEMGVIPIVNENDSVSYTEIESEDRLFGDNDMLSSVVAVLCRAKRLVIFSDIDGTVSGRFSAKGPVNDLAVTGRELIIDHIHRGLGEDGIPHRIEYLPADALHIIPVQQPDMAELRKPEIVPERCQNPGSLHGKGFLLLHIDPVNRHIAQLLKPLPPRKRRFLFCTVFPVLYR